MRYLLEPVVGITSGRDFRRRVSGHVAQELAQRAFERAAMNHRVDHSMINFDMKGAAFSSVVFTAAMSILCVLVLGQFFYFIFNK